MYKCSRATLPELVEKYLSWSDYLWWFTLELICSTCGEWVWNGTRNINSGQEIICKNKKKKRERSIRRIIILLATLWRSFITYLLVQQWGGERSKLAKKNGVRIKKKKREWNKIKYAKRNNWYSQIQVDVYISFRKKKKRTRKNDSLLRQHFVGFWYVADEPVHKLMFCSCFHTFFLGEKKGKKDAQAKFSTKKHIELYIMLEPLSGQQLSFRSMPFLLQPLYRANYFFFLYFFIMQKWLVSSLLSWEERMGE